MIPASVVEIVTPKHFQLNGLWFGAQKPRRVVIWIHGLSGSAFSKLGIVEKLVDRETAVITFNNRGHDSVARVRKSNGKKSLVAGGAFERFEDCVDDIDGALKVAKSSGAKEIYLAGHSTGCQKAAYWAYKRNKGVRGIVLLAPVSDYAGMVKKYGLPKIRHMQMLAKAMLKSGKHSDFVRSDFWRDEPNTPRRFLSLYTPDSTEQSIFSYFDPTRAARVLRGIRIPLFVILGEDDEYADRPTSEIAGWFIRQSPRTKLLIANETGHNFRGSEALVASEIRSWMKK